MLDGARNHDDPGVRPIVPPQTLDAAPLRTDRLAIALIDQQVRRHDLRPGLAMHRICRGFWWAMLAIVVAAVFAWMVRP
jgi:hypothetical protein